MKNLYGSILNKAGVGIFAKIKDLINSDPSKCDIAKLQSLWDSAGLGVEGMYWCIGRNGVRYNMIHGPNQETYLTMICKYNKSDDWDMEFTRDTWCESKFYFYKPQREELFEKLEKSGHFIIDKHPKGSEHWLVKIV